MEKEVTKHRNLAVKVNVIDEKKSERTYQFVGEEVTKVCKLWRPVTDLLAVAL